MLWIWILCGVAVLLLLFWALVAYCVFRYAFVRRAHPRDEDEADAGRPSLREYYPELIAARRALDDRPYEAIEMTSRDGLRLFARFYRNPHGTRVIVLMHGYRSSGRRDFGCSIPFYLEQGFHVLLPDQRAHGRSEGKYITFGIRESEDCADWLSLMQQRFGDAYPLWLGGLSMGSATVLTATALPLPASLRAIVADCGFSSPRAILRHVAAEMHLPAGLLLPAVNLYCRCFGGFSIDERSAVSALRRNTLPILFIHGLGDSFVPPEMTDENMAAATHAPTSCVLVERATHGMAYVYDTPRVQAALREFFSRY